MSFSALLVINATVRLVAEDSFPSGIIPYLCFKFPELTGNHWSDCSFKIPSPLD